MGACILLEDVATGTVCGGVMLNAIHVLAKLRRISFVLQLHQQADLSWPEESRLVGLISKQWGSFLSIKVCMNPILDCLVILLEGMCSIASEGAMVVSLSATQCSLFGEEGKLTMLAMHCGPHLMATWQARARS